LTTTDQQRSNALEEFLALTRWEVEAQAERTLARSQVGVTWLGLWHLMQRLGLMRVRELGLPAATSWAVHLGVIPKANAKR
jgi:hypothetical protein